MTTEFVIVLTTFPAEGDVEQLAAALVEERLAACVNVFPVRSIYTWKGQVELADERQLVIKTSAPRLGDLEERIRALHPYEVPEFLVLPIQAGSVSYLSWLAEATTPRP